VGIIKIFIHSNNIIFFFHNILVGLEDKIYGPEWAFYVLSIIFGTGQGFFFIIFFGLARDGPEGKIDVPDRAENLPTLQVYSTYPINPLSKPNSQDIIQSFTLYNKALITVFHNTITYTYLNHHNPFINSLHT